MSEHIKSGAEIWKALDENIKDRDRNIRERIFDKRIFEKWVPLSWLKDEKDELKNIIENQFVTEHFVMTKSKCLKIIDDWFKSLLEEKKS